MSWLSRRVVWVLWLALAAGQAQGLRAAETAAGSPTPAAKAVYRSPGTERMAAWLRDWYERFGGDNAYRPVKRLEELERALPGVQAIEQRVTMRTEIAAALLTLGRPEPALVVLTNLNQELRAARYNLSPRSRREVRMLEAIANLRLGEFENCIHHHNPDSCLLPIRGGGEHIARRGAEGAETILLELARQRKNDLDIRWLLNIAAMTLGHYPDGIPVEARIPESVFASDVPFPRFREVATQVGLGLNEIAGGTVLEDFDKDGLTDVLLSNWDNLGQCRLFRNQGSGRFEEITERAGLLGVTGGLNMVQADYNNDGWTDFYLIRGAWFGELGRVPDSLLRNNGDGTFADVTEEAGLFSLHPALSATWFDANNDGWLDLFVGNETGDPKLPHPCQLFMNKRDGTFAECAVPAGVAVTAFVRGVSAGDFDNDGWPDLYISALDSANLLLRNEGPAGTNSAAGVRFADVTARAGTAEPVHSFPAWFWDYDNDGWLDIFTCGYGAGASAYFSGSFGSVSLIEVVSDKLGLGSKAVHPRLYRNGGDGRFADVTQAARLNRALLTMGANFGDLDCDGYLDFYLGTGAPWYGSLVPNEMFRNAEGKLFQNVTSAGGFGHVQKGHAIAFGDLDNDGYQEVVANMGGAFPGDNFFDAVFANPGGTHRWLYLKLTGRRSNRSAIGARIKVVTSTRGQLREVHRVVCTGGSFGANPLRQEIGLGSADRLERLEVWWPASGQTNVYRGLEANRFYEVTEGAAEVQALPLKQFRLTSIAPTGG